MANKILKGLALAAGAGAALGFSAGLGRQRKNISSAETPPAPPHDLELRFERQAREIATLRAQAEESGRRASTEFTAFERRLASAREELPAAIDAVVTPRVDELRARLQSEMREAAANGLARIDQAIDEKLASRIAALETTLADQSNAIGSLNRRALETDANLQKLILSVERLCDRAGARPAAEPVAEPSFLDLPFQTQYEAALEREPATPPRMFASIK
jgi:uncharacterized coiled-coil protein SlyX